MISNSNCSKQTNNKWRTRTYEYIARWQINQKFGSNYLLFFFVLISAFAFLILNCELSDSQTYETHKSTGCLFVYVVSCMQLSELQNVLAWGGCLVQNTTCPAKKNKTEGRSALQICTLPCLPPPPS